REVDADEVDDLPGAAARFADQFQERANEPPLVAPQIVYQVDDAALIPNGVERGAQSLIVQPVVPVPVRIMPLRQVVADGLDVRERRESPIAADVFQDG